LGGGERDARVGAPTMQQAKKRRVWKVLTKKVVAVGGFRGSTAGSVKSSKKRGLRTGDGGCRQLKARFVHSKGGKWKR